MNEKRLLEVLTFQFKTRKGKLETRFNLFEKISSDFAEFINLLPNDNNTKKSVKIENKTINGETKSSFAKYSDIRCIAGKISSTTYGKIIKILDPNNKEAEPVYESKPEHGVEKVFFFLINVSLENHNGYIILERNGVYGIRTVFCSIFKRFIQDNYPEHTISFHDYIDKDILQRTFTQGSAKSITLTTSNIPQEISDKLFLQEDLKDYSISLTIKKKHGFFSTTTKSIIKKIYDTKNRSYLITDDLEVIGFGKGSEVSTFFKYKGKDKTINFDESFKLKSTYDINVNIDSYGESDLKEITTHAIDLLNEIKI